MTGSVVGGGGEDHALERLEALVDLAEGLLDGVQAVARPKPHLDVEGVEVDGIGPPAAAETAGPCGRWNARTGAPAARALPARAG